MSLCPAITVNIHRKSNVEYLLVTSTWLPPDLHDRYVFHTQHFATSRSHANVASQMIWTVVISGCRFTSPALLRLELSLVMINPHLFLSSLLLLHTNSRRRYWKLPSGCLAHCTLSADVLLCNLFCLCSYLHIILSFLIYLAASEAQDLTDLTVWLTEWMFDWLTEL